MKKILKLASSVFALMALFSLASCNSVDEEKVKEYLLTMHDMFGYSITDPDAFVIDETRHIKAYDPLLDDNDKTYNIWAKSKLSALTSTDMDLDDIEDCFTSSDNSNCEAVLVRFHLKNKPSETFKNILFERDGEFYQCIDMKFINKVEQRSRANAFQDFQDAISTIVP